MILADIHTHTSFSTDSDEPMENMIEAAISRGLRFLCFTEHMDKDYPTAPDFFLDTDSYLEKFLEMKDKYREKHQVEASVIPDPHTQRFLICINLVFLFTHNGYFLSVSW